jgi:hypothetical protein
MKKLSVRCRGYLISAASLATLLIAAGAKWKS